MNKGTQTRNPSRRRKLAFRSVLVVSKKSFLMEVQERNDEAMLELVRKKHKSVARVVKSHGEHVATLAAVTAELERLGITYKSVTRDLMAAELATGKWELVITVGGDGSVLDASHHVTDIPVLGVNSASTSHGHFCLARANSFPEVFAKIQGRKLTPLKLLRLEVEIDGKVLPELALNEVLVVDATIGDPTRTILTIDNIEEELKSDGLFIGTACGSTGWMKSYGATVVPIQDRKIQFLHRGLIEMPGQLFRLASGFHCVEGDIVAVSQMTNGLVHVDGKHHVYSFRRGSELRIRRSSSDALIFTDPNANTPYMATVRRSVGAWH